MRMRDEHPVPTSPARDDLRSYPPIADFAAIGDGRTVALVARDGTIPWLPLPSLDSPADFGAVLDRGRGGSFRLAPTEPFDVRRRYIPETNVLETTFLTGGGAAMLTDALTLPLGGGLVPFRELVRKIDGISGSVRFAWRVQPRFEYGQRAPEVVVRSGIPVATAGESAIAIRPWEAGAPTVGADSVSGSFTTSTGSRAVIAMSYAHQEPLVFPTRADVERRLDLTISAWRGWVATLRAEGPWTNELVRSALALKLLIQAATGAVAAAATTSLPEEIGGERNWDYRFCWVRDAAFIMRALLSLGCLDEAEAYFWWLMHASQLTHPRLQVLYRLDGGSGTRERVLPLEGYRGSQPVRIGNEAVEQLQLDVYGDVMETAWLYAAAGRGIDPEFGGRLAKIADLVCELWRQPDSGLWEVRSDPLHFTHSKMLCWVALDRATRLSEGGHVPATHADRWRSHARSIEAFIEQRCWSEPMRSYTRSAGSDDLDASVLLGIVFGYGDRSSRRHADTVDAIRRGLGRGPLLFRYRGVDGLDGGEGAFLSCSFWLVESLTLIGRPDDADRLMDELLTFSNDVGLFAEELDPATSSLLGNFPQGLTHLSLISASMAHTSHGRAA
jgi:GH15 family glucan-1,4-alpha-glucosidase